MQISVFLLAIIALFFGVAIASSDCENVNVEREGRTKEDCMRLRERCGSPIAWFPSCIVSSFFMVKKR